MAEAYKVKRAVSIPRPIHQIGERFDGTPEYETIGVNYIEDSYVLESEMTPDVAERASSGDLDRLLEPASKEDAEQYREEQANVYSVFIPEHEAEAVVMEEYGHETVPRDQLLELKSAGADAAKDAQEAAKGDGLDERPNLHAPEVANLADVERGEVELPGPVGDTEHVDDEKLVGVEQPPGIAVGETKEAAEQQPPEAQVTRSSSRRRPARTSSSSGEQASSEQKSDDKSSESRAS